MSPEAQRIAIFKACSGWGEYVEGAMVLTDGKTRVPDYLNDRNAMAGALSTRKGDLAFWSAYNVHLGRITKADDPAYEPWVNPELLLNPTAAQQADAFLRALNLIS